MRYIAVVRSDLVIDQTANEVCHYDIKGIYRRARAERAVVQYLNNKCLFVARNDASLGCRLFDTDVGRQIALLPCARIRGRVVRLIFVNKIWVFGTNDDRIRDRPSAVHGCSRRDHWGGFTSEQWICFGVNDLTPQGCNPRDW